MMGIFIQSHGISFITFKIRIIFMTFSNIDRLTSTTAFTRYHYLKDLKKL